ncbi:MAG: hypothetical protein K9I37_08220 [Crocinitomicaceae bacterium]|jgi:hypothetical protein|nr:hypothetical protein [Crocinitomicaceae bacterium]
MKKIIGSLILLTVLISSCNEKINLVGDFQETAVIYGLLDQADTLHYIKITRAFIGPGDAMQIAQIADSSYFDQVDATITEELNGSVTRTWQLKDTLIQDKNTNGVFYGPIQKVYYFKTLATGQNEVQVISPNPNETSLHKDAIYKLKVILNNGEFEVNGETELASGLTTTASSQNFTFKFSDNPGEYVSTSVAASSTGNCFVVNTKLEIEYNEYIGNNKTLKSFDWNLGEVDVAPNSSRTYVALGETFYDLVKSKVVTDPQITRRTFNGIRITLVGGAEELYNYMVVNKPSSTLAQTKPSYTNLSVSNGKRVIGIFSSRQTITSFKPFFVGAGQAYLRAIDKKSTKELCTGPITGLLLFCSDHPGDNVLNLEEPYACP